MITYHYVLMAPQHQTFLFLHWSFQIYKMYYQTDLPKNIPENVFTTILLNVHNWVYSNSFIQFFFEFLYLSLCFFWQIKEGSMKAQGSQIFIIIEYWYSTIHHIFNEWSNSCLKWRSTGDKEIMGCSLKIFLYKIIRPLSSLCSAPTRCTHY